MSSKTIAFKYFGERHTGDNIREKVIESLKNMSIDPMQVGKVMADNAANITKAFKATLLQTIGSDWTILSKVYDTEIEEFPADEPEIGFGDEDDTDELADMPEGEISKIIMQWDRICCVAHTLQLVVHDAEKGDAEATKQIQQCKDIVTFFRKSNHYHGKLKKSSNKTLAAPNVTRWDSTLRALKSILEIFHDVQQLLLAANNDPNVKKKERIEVPKNSMKAFIGEIISLLQPISEVTVIVQSAEKSTSAIAQSLIIYAYEKVNDIQVLRFHEMKRILLSGLQSRFQKLFKDESFVVATILNPGVKLGLFENTKANLLGLPTVEEARKALESQLELNVPVENESQIDTTEGDGNENRESKNSDLDAGFFGFLQSISEKRRRTSNPTKHYEIDAYLMECFNGNQTPLEYWKNKTDLYPRLSKLARIVLAIPASSGDYERLFSVAGFLKNARRNRLTPEVVEDLILYRENRRGPIMKKLGILEDS